MSRWIAVLLLALGPAIATAQEQITWLRNNLQPLQQLMNGEGDKPVLLWVSTDPATLDKLSKKLLADMRLVELSKEFACVAVERVSANEQMFDQFLSSGLNAFEGQFSFIDPKRVDRSQPVKLDDPRTLRKGFKSLQAASLAQLRANNTTVQQMISTMQSVLKTLGKKPAGDGKGKEKEKGKEAEKGKDGEKKKDEPAGKDEGKKKEEEKPAGPSPADQARTIVERGQAQEKAGKLYAALKLYQIASKIKGAAEAAEEATGHVRRLSTNAESAKIIAAQKAEEEAMRHLSVGKSYLSNKKHVTAAGYFKKALALLPASSPLAEEAKRLLAECEGKTDEG